MPGKLITITVVWVSDAYFAFLGCFPISNRNSLPVGDIQRTQVLIKKRF